VSEKADQIEVAPGLWFERHALDDLREQDVNAHVVAPRIFERLVENIAERGAMESVPYCAQIGGEGPIEIVSGHHRVRAARAAGLGEAWVLVDRAPMTRSKLTAKQLAHNFLVGSDDEDIVRQLIAGLDDPEDLLHTGAPQDLLPAPEADAVDLFLPHADFEWKHVGFAVLPHQLEAMDELCKRLQGPHDLLLLIAREQFNQFLQAASAYARLRDIRSGGTVVSVLCELALAELADAPAEGEGDEDGQERTDGERWVPLASVLGTTRIPEAAADVIVQAIERAKASGIVGERNAWQFVELLAADFLAGPDPADPGDAFSSGEAPAKGHGRPAENPKARKRRLPPSGPKAPSPTGTPTHGRQGHGEPGSTG
jgi:hypothetical protein